MSDAAQRLEQALELSETAMEMVEQRLRREHPDASDTEIARLLRDWRMQRPGAPDGDAVGRVVKLPRR